MKEDIRALGCSCTEARLQHEAHCLGARTERRPANCAQPSSHVRTVSVNTHTDSKQTTRMALIKHESQTVP